MADNPGTPGIDQVSTIDVGPSPTPSASPAAAPAAAPSQVPRPNAASPYGDKAPGAGGPQANPNGDPTDPTTGVGIEGELDVWEARYSMRNFLGRIIGDSVLTVLWLGLAIYTWAYGHDGLAVPTVIAGLIVAILWVLLIVRIAQARLGHLYRLSTRRLFVSTGIVRRETDQLELLRVQDVYTRQQSLLERWLNIGSVIIVSSEKNLPNYNILGVAEPKQVMDLIWHHARAEQDQRNVRVEQI